MSKGIFITFEGIDGCGKSTQIKLLAKRLTAEGYNTLLTYEPGGTPLADALRLTFKDPQYKNMDATTELLILNAARRDHVVSKILPALEQGSIVLSDRYRDATFAYQVYGRHHGDSAFTQLERETHERYIGLMPDRTYWCSIPPHIGRDRRANGPPDRLDSEKEAFYKSVDYGYMILAHQNQERIFVVNAERSIEEIHEEIYADAKRIIDERLRAT